MAYPSHIARDALRRALRAHPDAEKVLRGRQISTLPLADLRACLIDLGLEPGLIVSGLPARAYETKPEIIAAVEPIEEAPMIEHDPIETELQEIRSLIGTGGFSALDTRLRELVVEARKPAIVITETITDDGATVVHCARQTGKMGSWRSLFGVNDHAFSARETALWDGSHPNTPVVNAQYVWPQPQTAVALCQLSRGRNVYLFGAKGTGKTEFAQQLAAKTGRPFALISCDAGTDGSTLVGMTVPDASGGVSWQDGQLTRAIKTPGCVVCIDEPSIARAGALFVLQNVLANRMLYIAENGARVPVANGVLFVASDNTNGTGGGSRAGYTDTNRLNAAFLDRFGALVRFDYLPAAEEAKVIVGYTGCTPALAKLLVQGAALTRAAADNQTLSSGLGLRRLLAWAELLTDGIDTETAFNAAVLDCVPEQDRETLREQLLLVYDKDAVTAALNPVSAIAEGRADDPALFNPTNAGRAAARDFANT